MHKNMELIMMRHVHSNLWYSSSLFGALLAFAVQNDMLIHQMNVVTAFLNGKLNEKNIYATA